MSAAGGPLRVHDHDSGERIAIVGIGLRFPGAHGAAQYWSNLRGGVESIRDLSDDELAARGVPARTLRDPHYVKRAAVLDGIDRFDAGFFGFSPRDAAILDPQHRLFLETCWEALEDAGHVPAGLKGAIGVFGGCGFEAYFALNLLTNPGLVDSVGLFLLRHTGNDKDFLTTRVSYCLNLTGPSVNVQTACSTSLVAVHQACQSLTIGECDMALAGGVSIEIPHGLGYLHKPGEILSPEGRCRAFDALANGTVFGSGVGVVVLRRLEDALRDGDRIYAVIRGSAVNNDGAGKVGYMAPSVDGQAAVVAEALEAAAVDPATIGYVEAHGSGTPIGEPIEVAALTRVFQRGSPRRNACGIGSVKANLGHLDTAAGIASLIKVALALHHGELPPMPNFRTPNPAIRFDETPFFVVDRLLPWPRGEQPRRGGVTSLGIGGTNAHVVLEEAPAPAPVAASTREWQLLTLSARSPVALDAAARRLALHLREQAPPLPDVAWTLHAGRHDFEHRRVLAARTPEEAARLLESGDAQRVFAHRADTSPAEVVALLPGGGSQHARMGLDLYAHEPVFRAQVERGLEALLRRTGRDLRPVWLAPSDAAAAARELERPSLQLPALFILEHALAQLWASLGVRFSALIGHSLGENTAACLAGVMSFEDALGLVALRGELFELAPPGAMLSVPLGPEALAAHLGPELDLAAANAPGVSVVSGPPAAIEDLERRLVAGNVEARRVPITTAAHSRLVEPILPRFLEYLRGIELKAPRIPILSNRTGTWLTDEQAVRPESWVDHLRQTVRFSEGLALALADPGRVLLEVGPGKTLSSLARQQPAAARARGVIPSMRHADEPLSDVEHFLTAAGRLWAVGAPIELGRLWTGERRARVALPTYPFEHRRYWIDPGQPASPVPAEDAGQRRVDPLDEGLFRPVWRESAAPASSDLGPPSAWLLFLDPAGVGARLARRLRALGHHVITVRESDDNRRLADDDYALSPERGREGYDLLVRDLVALGRLPRHIVHLWLLTPDEGFRPGSNFFHHTQERGFYSLFFLAQALGEQGLFSPLHLTVVGNGLAALDGEVLRHPSKATVLGPCKVIPRELPDMTCQVVDLPLPVARTKGAWRALRPARLDALAELVERELPGAPHNGFAAWRAGQRYEQALEHISLPEAQAGRTRLRPRGVYLITGGLGGLGLEVARHLANQVQARLVLVGRTALPERQAWDAWLRDAGRDDRTSRRIRAVRELEALGAQVLTASADVSDVEGMRAVLDEARRHFGPLNGVFHAAGVLKDAPLLGKTPEQVEEVFAPKVHGTLVLDALLAGEDLDLLVLFSSLSSFIAPAGQVDYVAANAFLDAYSRTGRFEHALVVNWGVWNGVGMASDALRAVAAAPARGAGRPPRHPLFDSRVGDPDAPVVLEARWSSERQWMLDEHRSLQHVAVLPGSAFIELANEALLEADEDRPFEIRDLLLFSPLFVPDGDSRTVQLELRPDVEGYSFRVRSCNGSRDRWETHAEARLAMRPLPPAGRLPLAEIEARCRPTRVAAGPQGLPAAQDAGMRFGRRWRTLREVRVGAGEVLATLELRPELAADAAQFRLHPALLDMALTCGLELPELSTADGLWVPLSWRSVRVHAALPSKLRAWARLRSPTPGAAAGGLPSFDVTVTDGEGQILLEAEGFVLHRLPTAGEFGPARTDAVRTAGSNGHSHTNGFHTHAWSPGLEALEHNHAQGLTPSEGLGVLDRVLAAPEPCQVVATSLDLEDLERQAESLVAVAPALGEPEAEPGDDAELGGADGIERTLAGFWRELLGVRRVGLRDNFFDLGGHSLIAVRLFARIKKAFDVDFPISLLFEAPSIGSCAEAIRRARGDAARVEADPGAPVRALEPRYRHLVPMHPGQGGDKSPFFLVAGMFGNVLNLRHLAHLLGNERRFFGLQALGLYGTQQPHETIEEMAAAYVAELRSVCPHGPYLLGGFSGGGITAFEMSRQIQAAGETVGVLVMLDTYLPQAPPLSASDRAKIHWDRLRAQGPVYASEWVRNRLRWEIGKIRKLRDPHDPLLPSEFRSEEVGAAFRRAIGRYELQTYAGPITLFRPKLAIAHVLGPGRVTNAKRQLIYEDNGWGPYCRRVDVHEVPGDHDSMVLEPNVRVLASRLRKCIQAVER